MKNHFAISGLLLLTGCAQFTTSDEERVALSASATQKGDEYVQCLRTEASKVLSLSRDAAFIVERAKSACEAQLEAYRVAESDLLLTEYMVVDEQVEAAVGRLDKRGQDAVAAMLSDDQAIAGLPAAAARPAAPNRPPAAAVAGASAGVAASAAGASGMSGSPVAVPGDFQPSFDQRVYLDCMRDQAAKYVRLSEPAATIAEVAANRCRTHLAGSNQAVLEQEGRALVMGNVLDARLDAPAPR